MQGHAHWLAPFFYVGLKGHMCQMEMYLVLVTSGPFPCCSANGTISFSIILTTAGFYLFFVSLTNVVFQFSLCSLCKNHWCTEKKMKKAGHETFLDFPTGDQCQSHIWLSWSQACVTALDLHPGTTVLTRQPETSSLNFPLCPRYEPTFLWWAFPGWIKIWRWLRVFAVSKE